MERSVPSAIRVLLLCGVIALIILVWLALLAAATLGIGPATILITNVNPETKARMVRYTLYFLALAGLTTFFVHLAKRHIIKTIPDGFAAVIESNNGSKVITLARHVWIMPFFEKVKRVDLRPHDLNFAHEVVTHDLLQVTLHVNLKWQPYAEDLQMALTANIHYEAVLKELVQRQLTQDTGKRSLDDIQNNLETLAFHIMRFIAYREAPFDCAPKYGIGLLDAKIIRVEIPPEIIELNKLKKISELRKKYGPTQPGVSAS